MIFSIISEIILEIVYTITDHKLFLLSTIIIGIIIGLIARIFIDKIDMYYNNYDNYDNYHIYDTYCIYQRVYNFSNNTTNIFEIIDIDNITKTFENLILS